MPAVLCLFFENSVGFCTCEGGGSSLEAYTVIFSLFAKNKKPAKDLGPGVYSLRGRERVNEQEGKWWTREEPTFGDRQLLSLGSFSAGEHGLWAAKESACMWMYVRVSPWSACRCKNNSSIIPLYWQQPSGILTHETTNRINVETQNHRPAVCSFYVNFT